MGKRPTAAMEEAKRTLVGSEEEGRVPELWMARRKRLERALMCGSKDERLRLKLTGQALCMTCVIPTS
jgi:hypothetical protein